MKLKESQEGEKLNEISISFTILPWFILLVLLLMVFSLYSIVKMRLKYIRIENIQLEKRIAERTFQLRNTISAVKHASENLRQQIKDHKRLIQTITHDLRSPLRFLSMIVQHIYQNPSDGNAVEEVIKSIQTSSFQLYNYINNILEYSKILKPEDLSTWYGLHDFVEEKIKIFLNIENSNRVFILNDVSTYQILNSNRFLFYIIIHNLLENAIKNTTSGKTMFSSETRKGKIFLIIEDTGNGMSPNQLKIYNSLEL